MKKIDLQWHSAAHSCLEQLGGDQIQVWLESHNIFTIMPEVLDFISLQRLQLVALLSIPGSEGEERGQSRVTNHLLLGFD